MITLILIVSVLCAVYLKLSHQYRRRMKMAAKIPAYPGGLPLIGHAHHFVGLEGEEFFTFVKSLSENASQNGGINVAYLAMRPHFTITDPESAFTILNEALDKSYMYKFLTPWLGNGLFTSDADIWYPHRKSISPAFNPGVISSFQDVFEKQAEKLTHILADRVGTGPFEISKYLEACFLGTVYETALGMPEGETSVDENFAKYTHKMFAITNERIRKTQFHWNFIFNWSKLKRDQDSVIENLHKISNKIIENRKLEYNNNNNENDYNSYSGRKFKPFLKHILEQCAFSDKEVREEVDTIIMAGEDTSALVMQYILIMLGSYTDVQNKLYEEIQTVFHKEHREVTKDDLGMLKYAEAVIYETLRLYPIGCVVPRDCYKDVKLRNYTIPSGSTCMIVMWGIHRGSHWGPDADSFRPERWLDAATLPDLKTSFGGFGLGKRNCLGKQYAIASMKTILVHLLREYRVKSDVSKLKLQVDIMLRPASGNHISLEPRLNNFYKVLA